MSTFFPLPDRPSLEYMRKEAKSLLRRLRAGDREALDRAYARHAQLEKTPHPELKLADAQLVIAREYGFTSWPRLVRYLEDVERQQHGHMQLHGDTGWWEQFSRRFVAEHGRGSAWAARSLAAYVPRFYGQSPNDVLKSSVTLDEARLAVARGHGAPSWAVLLERVGTNEHKPKIEWEQDPIRHASKAMATGEVSALERVVAEHPQLLHPSEFDLSMGRTLMISAIWQEHKLGAAHMQPIMEWLAAHGFDRQLELNRRLCTARGAADVQYLLDMGADPNWIAPSGMPVLEHALLRYRKP